MSEDLVGVVYALPSDLIERFFEGKRTFAKYLGRSPTTRLEAGHKLIFYASHDRKELLGEAVIKKVDFLPPSELSKRLGRSLFLFLQELTNYVRGRGEKPLLILQLSHVRRYPSPIPYPEPMTMAGRYVTRDAYEKLFK